MTLETKVEELKKETEIDYHSRPELSRSQLKDILTSPQYFYKKHILKEIPDKETTALDYGRKIHMAINEPHRLREEYIVLDSLKLPAADYDKVKGRCQWTITAQDADWVTFTTTGSVDAEATARERLQAYYNADNILFPVEWARLIDSVNGLQSNPEIVRWLDGNVLTEQELFGEIDDVAIRVKLDWLRDNSRIADYKSEDKSINPTWLLKKCRWWSYDMQAYIYTEISRQNGLPITGFDFIFQNKQTYEGIVLTAGEKMLERGRIKTKLAIETFHKCMATNEWPEFIDASGNTNRDCTFNSDDFENSDYEEIE